MKTVNFIAPCSRAALGAPRVLPVALMGPGPARSVIQRAAHAVPGVAFPATGPMNAR